MGLFSTEKQVFVDSVVYNLAGPPDQRPNYLKNALMSAVMSPSNPSVGESITRALLKGPASTCVALATGRRTKATMTSWV